MRSLRFKTGKREKPNDCFMIELKKDALSPYQYFDSFDNKLTTTYQRYTDITPNHYFSKIPELWNAQTKPHKDYTKPWSFVEDRQVAFVESRLVRQGSYKCANNGECIAPDTCACSKGWIGFDCRVPVCEQGYFETDQASFVESINDYQELERFKPFLYPSRSYFLDPKDEGYSNPIYTAVEESFRNYSHVERKQVEWGGKQYLQMNGSSQGGYKCSIRSVTEWEDYRSRRVFEHPNYYSRYMDRKVEGDGKVYTHWNQMGWKPLYQKTNVFQVNSTSIGVEGIDGQVFIYTDKGYMRDGYWHKTNFSWTKGYCIIEFERVCDDPSKEIDLEESAPRTDRCIVQDTDLVSEFKNFAIVYYMITWNEFSNHYYYKSHSDLGFITIMIEYTCLESGDVKAVSV